MAIHSTANRRTWYCFPLSALVISLIAAANVLWVSGVLSAPESVKKAATHKSPEPVLTIGDFPDAGYLDALAYSPKGDMLAALFHKEVMVFDTKTGKLRYRVEAGYRIEDAPRIAFRPDGRVLALAFANTLKVNAPVDVRLYEATTGKLLLQTSGHQGVLRGITFSPDRQWFITASDENTVQLWNPKNLQKIAVLKALSSLYSNVACSRDGRLLACGGEGGLTIWDLKTRKARLFPGSSSEIISVAFHPNGKHLALGLADPGVGGLTDGTTWEVIRPSAPSHSEIEIWDVQRPRKVLTLFRGEVQSEVEKIQFSPDGLILAQSDHNSVRLWDSTTGMLLGFTPPFDHLSFNGLCFAFSPDGRFLATEYADEDTFQIKVWRIETLRGFFPAPKPPAPKP